MLPAELADVFKCCLDENSETQPESFNDDIFYKQVVEPANRSVSRMLTFHVAPILERLIGGCHGRGGVLSD